ncbi:MAG: phage tail assembly protein [Candidatus Accumulibacter sp.]|jgi:hypothetical protein|nr:phage tail assembly protein [Accumulibacter sp.]
MCQEFVEIALDYPIDTAAGKVDKLRMRRAKLKDHRRAARQNRSPEEREVAIMAAVTGLVPEDMDEMDFTDFMKLQDAFRELHAQPGRPLGGDGLAGEMVPLSAERD